MMFLLPLEVSKTRKFPFSETRSFPGSYKSLARIGGFVRKIAHDAGFEDFAIYSIELAVDEACSNIIEHAYQGEGKGIIRCTCSANETTLTIILKDKGQSFDPSNITRPNLSQNLDEREAHGLGLYFIRQWMDEVNFASNGSENVLTMVKRR
jgi:serine/threonine-protein kinase RsbW